MFGNIVLNGKNHNMKPAIGYIEKDWGEQFPESWIWLQGNSGPDSYDDINFMCSIAKIQYKSFAFLGLIAVISINNNQFRFATYNNSKIESMNKILDGVDIILKRYGYTLKIHAETLDEETLKAPTINGMDRDIKESISANISLMLSRRNNILCEISLDNCGMEISNFENLIKKTSATAKV
jgi:tocopherol cyclase